MNCIFLVKFSVYEQSTSLLNKGMYVNENIYDRGINDKGMYFA
jgi:hypothetical protein